MKQKGIGYERVLARSFGIEPLHRGLHHDGNRLETWDFDGTAELFVASESRLVDGHVIGFHKRPGGCSNPSLRDPP